MSAVTSLESLDKLNALLTAKADKLTVIDFTATWCGPCKAIAPVYEKLANQYRNVVFLKVDVDAAQDIARAYGVSAMPTFVFVKNSRKIHQVRGADANALEAGIKQYSTAGAGSGEGGAFPGQGNTLSGSPVPTEVPPASYVMTYAKYAIFAVSAYLWFTYAGRGAKGPVE